VDDLGPPVAFVALREGTPVYDSERKRIGVVEEVVADDDAGIFEGLVIHSVPLPGRHLVADVEQISALHERGVLLSVDRATLRRANEKSGRRSGDGEEALEHPVQATLRRAWDRINPRR
jgi:hypothetical protein